MPTGTFTVSAVAYPFEVLSEQGQADEEAGSDVDVQRIYGGDVSYVDLGGQALATRPMNLYFATAAAFASLKGVRGRQGTLVTDRDGTETAVLQSIHRTKRNWDGVTEASSSWLIVS